MRLHSLFKKLLLFLLPCGKLRVVYGKQDMSVFFCNDDFKAICCKGIPSSSSSLFSFCIGNLIKRMPLYHTSSQNIPDRTQLCLSFLNLSISSSSVLLLMNLFLPSNRVICSFPLLFDPPPPPPPPLAPSFSIQASLGREKEEGNFSPFSGKNLREKFNSGLEKSATSFLSLEDYKREE